MLEKLESPFPSDFFVYLDILHRLKFELHKIDIRVTIVKPLQSGVTLLGPSSSEYPKEFDQLVLAPIADALL